MSFVHLHLHSQYSLLESAVKLPDAVARAKELAMPAMALTDLGNMFGAVDFYFAAKEAGVKPIFGCEVYYTVGSRFVKNPISKKRVSQASADGDEANRLFHLVLLVKNEEGYRNICELVTRSYTEGFHVKPRVDRELLEKLSGGLVCLSAGTKGEVAYHCATGRPDRAADAARWFRDVYKDEYFLELQESGLPPQAMANSLSAEIAKELSIPLVACADVHYLKKEDAAAQEVLMCIGAGRNIDDSRPVRLNPDEFWFKDEAAMRAQFQWVPEAVDNTMAIAQRCDFQFKLKDGKGRQIYHLPEYSPTQWADAATEPPEHMQAQIELAKEFEEEAYPRSKGGQFSSESFLRILARQGLEKRYPTIAARRPRNSPLTEEAKGAYRERLEAELDMIVRTGFAGYFLVVSDFITYAKSKGIPVGPGRGSGAGSIVAYCLYITDIDPIPFNLLFERFINPERISMPDFDVDFCQDRRSEVIEYVVRKYGRDKVSQIITFGKLLARGVIRDVGRVMSLSYAEVDSLAKLVPEELGITLEEAFEKEPRLRELTEKEPRVAKLFENARALEGLGRHASVHAAGVVITNRPLIEYCPLYIGKDGESVVQFDKDFAEKIGLVKFDFLGLKTLTVIENAVKYIRETEAGKIAAGAQPFSIERIDYEDASVYELISRGDTDGVFQLESSGMKDLCMRVQPTNLEDVTAICALYRPGPLNSGMVDDYINRKHGRTEVRYELPQLKDVLEETYGVIVYQEQVMRIARVLAGYSLGEADILRRAMGKKKPEEMAKQKDRFVKGCEGNKIETKTAEHLFDLLAKFAEYGFNKSHSAAYGLLSYQTAFLKHYYPAQFMAALMATEMDNTDKITQYIGDARKRGIKILPPDVNESQKTFSVVGLGIRFGLEAIKGVGGVAVDAILAERAERGPFTSFVDFCKRVNLRKVNKKVIECLVSTGAFDSVAEQNRATLLESMQSIMDYASGLQEEASLGQVSMFDQYQPTGLKIESDTSHLFTLSKDWPENKRLQMEKQLVGFYVSGHPLEKWWPVVRGFVHGDFEWLKAEFERRKKLPLKERGVVPQKEPFGSGGASSYRNEGPRWDVVLCGMASSLREIITKKGTRMAFAEFEDTRGKVEAICFPEAYEQYGALLKSSMEESLPVMVSGNVGLEEETLKVFIRTVDRAEECQNKRINSVTIRLDPAQVNAHVMAQLRAALVRHSGRCSTFLEYRGKVAETVFSSRHALPKELCTSPTAEMAQEVNRLFGGDVVKFF